LRIWDRKPGGILSGVFIDDRRDPEQRVSIIADHGVVRKNDRGSFMILEDGHLERFEVGKREPVLVAFKSYAFDLSQLSRAPTAVAYNVHERLTPELLAPPPEIQQVPHDLGEFIEELNDRLFAPLYPLAFALLAFAFLGLARTTRQSRNFAVTIMILVVLVVRISGFALSTIGVNHPIAIVGQYLLLVLVSAVSVLMIMRGIIVDPPAGLMEAINRIGQRLVPRAQQA
jgi:lipopolysaccharide export system permease protein